MSKLKRYATAEKGRIASLARAAKVSDAQMSRIVHGTRGASLPIALAISKATDDAITPGDVAAAFIARETQPRPKVNTRKAKKRTAAARAGR